MRTVRVACAFCDQPVALATWSFVPQLFPEPHNCASCGEKNMLSRSTLAWSWAATILFTLLGGFVADRYSSGNLWPGLIVGIALGLLLGTLLSRARAQLIKWPDPWI